VLSGGTGSAALRWFVAEEAPMSLLWEFIYLQILDVLTTVTFLMQGVKEANPVVNWAIATAPHPLGGLILLKLFAVALAVYCVIRSRHRLLRNVNIFFACLVVYNLVVIIFAHPAIN
jgi:hypothetical protein